MFFLSIEKQAVRSARCSCESTLVKNGRVKRVVQTLGGKVTYIRTRMLCRSCGKNYYPLDQTMAIPSGIKHSMRATSGNT